MVNNEDEELLKIAQGIVTPLKNNKKTSTVEMEVKAFVQHSGVTEGVVYIPYHLVYDFYCTWSPIPFSVKKFNKEFSKYFKITRVVGTKCFRIHPPSVGLPEYYSMYKDPRFYNKAKYTSKYRGVYPMFGFFIARYKELNNSYYIGKYATEKEAAMAYDVYLYKLYGNKGNFNFKSMKREYEKAIQQEKAQAQIFEAGVSSLKCGIPSGDSTGNDGL